MKTFYALCLFALASFAGLAPTHGAEPADKEARAAAEKKFEQMLHGAVLIGNFTVDGRENGKLTPERYTIESVTKIDDELWRFDVRIQYNERDLKLPLPLPVKWAGNTPVVTLDKMEIPPLGVFSARVLFDDDRYAGTWEHVGKAGGALFGVIKRDEEKPANANQ